MFQINIFSVKLYETSNFLSKGVERNVGQNTLQILLYQIIWVQKYIMLFWRGLITAFIDAGSDYSAPFSIWIE